MRNRPWLGGSVLEDCGDCGLRLLDHQLLREACRFQQIAKDEFAHMIECGFEHDHEFGVQ